MKSVFLVHHSYETDSGEGDAKLVEAFSTESAASDVVVPRTAGHLTKRVFFALEVPDGKSDKEQVKDSGDAQASLGRIQTRGAWIG